MNVINAILYRCEDTLQTTVLYVQIRNFSQFIMEPTFATIYIKRGITLEQIMWLRFSNKRNSIDKSALQIKCNTPFSCL